MTASDVLAHQ